MKQFNVLVTGGPVHGKIDPVKLVTNKFRGGMMAELSESLSSRGANVTYLCAKGSKEPKAVRCSCGKCPAEGPWCSPVDRITVIYHDGIHDYMEKVCDLAKGMDAVILGAAVANLIPVAYYANDAKEPGAFNPLGTRIPMPLKDKFPSHNYKPGDRIFMEWTIAPRIIDVVKAHMPKTGHLFGFKLLAGQPHEELIRAAYEVLLESKATAVFANDPTKGLENKYIVTKERGVHEVNFSQLAGWIMEILHDKYYSTEYYSEDYISWKESREEVLEAIQKMKEVIEKYRDHFVEVENGMKFGTVAWRVGTDKGFVTTGRGKRELDETTYVSGVDHLNKVVRVIGSKSTLNAPLLDRIFYHQPKVQGIVHLHEQRAGMPTLEYAPPGTVRDSMTRLCEGSFNIEGHGCFILLDKEGKELV